jgi:HSP20 family molecular chaperone IbpA
MYTTKLFADLINGSFKDWTYWNSTGNLEYYYFKKIDDSYTFELPVPGLTKEDLTVKIVGGKLEIKNSNENCRWSPKFTETFILPKDADAKNIKANVKNGLLNLTIGLKEDSENIINII